MGETVSVERAVAAPADAVWALVADITRMCEFSPENTRCEWIGGAEGPVVGAKFRGTNENGNKKWKTVATVVDAQPGRSFAFVVKAGPFGVARWEYQFDSTGNGCRVTETWIDQRGFVGRTLGGPVSGVADRAAHNRSGMETTLERLAAAAERASA
jgi:ribosome-associated toxin RatA of RatAB toxin-antitoxin module